MEILKSIYRGLLRIMPMKPALYLIYFRGYRKILNLKNPKYFGEKIQWLKLYGNLRELAPYVDKYLVRDFVAKTIGEKYLNTLLGLYNTPEEIDVDALPDRFVLKCTNGSGSVLICKDKATFNWDKANKTMHQWLKDDFWRMKKEPQYRDVQNRIIAERYLEDESGSLRDYKFYCYDGEPVYYGIFSDRYADKTIDMYDMSGKKLDVLNGGVKNSDSVIPQDEQFQTLVDIVKKLASPFQFVRVDFYIAEGKLYFGELTFTDGAGSDAFHPIEFDIEMGKRIKLEHVLKR